MAKPTLHETPLRSFQFFRLPVEIQLKILENTSLISPTSNYDWEFSKGYYIVERWKAKSWYSPASLFLVDRAFYDLARRVFWQNNHVTIHPDLGSVFKVGRRTSDDRPKRYVGSEFLINHISPNTLPYLSSIQCKSFAFVRKSEEEEAREDWFQSLDLAKNNGLVNLKFVTIRDYFENGPGWDAMSRGTKTDAATLLKTYIKKNIWPFSESEVPALVSGVLLVECSADGVTSRYRIRKMGEIVPSHQKLGYRWGSQMTERTISTLKDVQGLEDDVEMGGWVEEIWMSKRYES